MRTVAGGRGPSHARPLPIHNNTGGYGVTVNTEVCGAFDSGSIPDSRPF